MSELPVSTRVDLCNGHDACRPRAFQTWSPNVTAEGFEVARETDTLQPHGCSEHRPHTTTVTRGHPTVTVNDLPIAHVQACVGCQSKIVGTGRPSVVVGPPAAPLVGREGAVRAQVSKAPFECRGQKRFQQQLASSCAIASTRSIIAQMAGKDVPEAQLRKEGYDTELYDPNYPAMKFGTTYKGDAGSDIRGVPYLLEGHGVEAHTVPTPAKVDADFIKDVTNDGTTPAMMGVMVPGGHAIIVDGMDDKGNVLIRDPWHSGAAGCKRQPLADFAKTTTPTIRTVKMGKPPEGYSPGLVPRPKPAGGGAS
jgi:uncharacterized Zn-binding protein involved in type VI secretion